MKNTNQSERGAIRRLAGLSGAALELSDRGVALRIPVPKLFKLVAKAAVLVVVVLSFPWIIKSAAATRRAPASHHHDDTEAVMPVHGRKLIAIPASKKEALSRLEDADLEPPPSQKKHQRNTKYQYLPDLMGGSLADYPRRVFIDVGPAGRKESGKWFEKHYPPKKNLDFDVISIDVNDEEANKEGGGGGGVDSVGMSEWLKRNAKDEEYVVMKAEAEVVEEMMKGKAIGLVDELFLGCKNQWMKGKKSKRAYWECLALYGRLKDEGVAVHQWWD